MYVIFICLFMHDFYLISSRWCALMARICIRLGYRACAAAIIGLIRMCADLASAMPTEMGVSLPLEQVFQGPPEVDSTTELEAGSREEHMEERMGENMAMELSASESEGERVEDQEIDVSLDNRPEYWEWAHDWEDLDWSEDIWVEDELVSVDLNEATIPDEVWE